MKKYIVSAPTAAAFALFALAGCANSNANVQASETSKIAQAQPALSRGAAASPEALPAHLGQKIDSDRFIGAVYLETLVPNEPVYHFPQTNSIVFEPGARSSWHVHGGMVVLATGGVGYYQEEGRRAQILRPGDVVQIPAGIRHWHGAAPDSWFSQIVIYDSHWTGTHGGEAAQHVSDEYYAHLEQEEYADRSSRGAPEDLIFGRAEKPLDLPVFSGPVYVSDILPEKNAANAPSMHYVVFAPGTYNNWHSHAGGQILIATDGIGFHQIEGQPVQILRPGDVALCPPGVKHWHGGNLNGTFAHIAVNTNPDRPGVEWLEDRLSAEDFAALNQRIEQ